MTYEPPKNPGEVEGYVPRVTPLMLDIVFYLGLVASVSMFVFPEAPVLVRIGSAVTLVASALGRAYRARAVVKPKA